jgi:hypothetical protein
MGHDLKSMVKHAIRNHLRVCHMYNLMRWPLNLFTLCTSLHQIIPSSKITINIRVKVLSANFYRKENRGEM